MKMKNKLIDIHNELLDLENKILNEKWNKLLEIEDQLNCKYCDILDKLVCDIVIEEDQCILEFVNKDWLYFDTTDQLEDYLINEENEFKIKKLFNYLDWYWFSNFSEIVNAIQDYYYPYDWNEQPSYFELVEYRDIAMDYSEYKQLDFDFEE